MNCIKRKEMSCCALASDFTTQFFRNVFNGLTQTTHPIVRERMLGNPRNINFFPIEVYDENDNIQNVLEGRGPQYPTRKTPHLVKRMHHLLDERAKNV